MFGGVDWVEQFSRTELLLGAEIISKLGKTKVAVFGVGGVGGYAVEALVRSGIGHISIIDNDVVAQSNLNRQIIAVQSTIGRSKVEVMKDRILDINPDCIVDVYSIFYLPEQAAEFNFAQYDYIVDAIDTITAKIDLVLQADQAGVPIISSMGAGNKIDPTQLRIGDIYETSVCPLAKVIRRELRKRNIKKLKVVYSTELAMTPTDILYQGKKVVPGSMVFVPATAGLIMAAEVVKDLIKELQKEETGYDF